MEIREGEALAEGALGALLSLFCVCGVSVTFDAGAACVWGGPGIKSTLSLNFLTVRIAPARKSSTIITAAASMRIFFISGRFDRRLLLRFARMELTMARSFLALAGRLSTRRLIIEETSEEHSRETSGAILERGCISPFSTLEMTCLVFCPSKGRLPLSM